MKRRNAACDAGRNERCRARWRGREGDVVRHSAEHEAFQRRSCVSHAGSSLKTCKDAAAVYAITGKLSVWALNSRRMSLLRCTGLTP